MSYLRRNCLYLNVWRKEQGSGGKENVSLPQSGLRTLIKCLFYCEIEPKRVVASDKENRGRRLAAGGATSSGKPQNMVGLAVPCMGKVK